MVRKKDLLNRLNWATNCLENTFNKVNLLTQENKELKEKIENMSSIITELTEKVEFMWHQTDYDKKSDDNIYDEWLNGSRDGDK